MNPVPSLLRQHLDYLQLPFLKEHHVSWAQEAAQASRTHLDYLTRLIEGEFQQRQQRAIQRRVQGAHFPVIKTLD